MLNSLAEIFWRPDRPSDFVTLGFVGLMFFLFSFGFFGLTLPIRRHARAFKRAATSILEGEGAAESSPFPRRFQRLNELWQQFVTKYRTERLEIGSKLVGIVRPEDVFTSTQVLEAYNRRMAMALAGVFAGIGILGTFVGLFLGLLGIETQTDDQLLTGVRQLLGGMSMAFVTSIVGISFSLVWLLLDRVSYNGLRRQVGQFFDAVRSRFPVRSVESVLLESLALGVEQKTILQNLGTDLASAFQEAINEGLTQEISPALDSIAETLDKVSSSVQEQQVEALGDLVEEFQEQLLAAAGKQFEEFAGAIKTATEWQERVNRDVGALFERVGTLSQQTARLLENSSHAADLFLNSLEALRESHETTATAAADLRTMAERTATISEQLGAQVNVFAEANAEIREAMAQQIDSVGEQVNRLALFWGDLREHLDGLAENLQASLLEFTNVSQEKLGEIFARFDSEMSTVVEHLAGTLGDMRDVTDELIPGVQQIQTAMTEALEPVRSSRGTFESLTESVRLLGPLPESIRVAADRVQTTQEAVDKLNEQLASLNGELRRGGSAAGEFQEIADEGELPRRSSEPAERRGFFGRRGT